MTQSSIQSVEYTVAGIQGSYDYKDLFICVLALQPSRETSSQTREEMCTHRAPTVIIDGPGFKPACLPVSTSACS